MGKVSIMRKAIHACEAYAAALDKAAAVIAKLEAMKRPMAATLVRETTAETLT